MAEIPNFALNFDWLCPEIESEEEEDDELLCSIAEMIENNQNQLSDKEISDFIDTNTAKNTKI